MKNFKKFNNIQLFFFIFFLSLITRLILNYFFDFNFKDAAEYKRLAEVLLETYTFDSVLAMPLYPIFLATSKIIFNNHFVLDYIVSSIFPIIVFLLSNVIFKNKNAAILSCLISVFYPMNVFYSISGLTENLYVFLLYSSLLFFYKKNFYIAVTLMVLALYTRAVLIYVLPFLIIIFFYISNLTIQKSINKFVGLSLLFILLMSPWWIMNYEKHNNFVLTNLGTGLVMHLGNNEKNVTGGNDMGVDSDYSNYSGIKNKYLRDKVLMRDGLDFIKRNPEKFMNLSVKKFKRFWNFFPNHDDLKKNYIFKYVIFFSYFPILLLSIIYLYINFNLTFLKRISPLLLLIAYTTLIHIITIASLRYRYPIEPILIIFSGQYIVQLLRKFNN